MGRLIEVEVAERLFDGRVFGFLQAFGKFAGQNVFLVSFSFHRRPELRFHSVLLLPKQTRRIVQIN